MPTYFNENAQTWYCKFYYRDFMGRHRQKKKGGFKLQKEAREWERAFIRQNEGGPDITFNDLYAIYANDMGHRLRRSTLITKEHLVRTKILPYFGEFPVNQIGAHTIREWQNIMWDYKDSYGDGYSQTYLKAMNNQLSAIFNYAVRYFQLTSNPCHAAGSMGKKQAEQNQFWSPKEFHIFLDYLRENTEMHLLFSLLYYTGIRIGELLALTLADFYKEQGIININKSYHRINGQDFITPPKTPKSLRVVALPEFLQLQLEAFIKEKAINRPSERLFSCTKYYISKYMTEACQRSGVAKIRIHDLRHSHASLLIERGFSPLLIAERLGHENIETTLNTYSHLYPHRQAELAQNLQEIYQYYENL